MCDSSWVIKEFERVIRPEVTDLFWSRVFWTVIKDFECVIRPEVTVRLTGS